MHPRTSAILLAIALALGAFVYFYEIGGEDARREAEEQARRLFPGLEQGAIEWIAFTMILVSTCSICAPSTSTVKSRAA